MTNDELFGFGYYYEINTWGCIVHWAKTSLDVTMDTMEQIACVYFDSPQTDEYAVEQARQAAISHFVKTRLDGECHDPGRT